MEYQIVSNVSDKMTLFIDNDMTVGEVRTIIDVMLDVSADLGRSMSYNGKQLTQDELTWLEMISMVDSNAQNPSGNDSVGGSLSRKIFYHVGGRRPQEGANHEALRAAVSGNERLQREQARLMEPMLDTMAQNPAFMESILNMNPALKKMAKEHPEVAKQMRDPETIKMMMMSQFDPDRRRELNRQLELQLAQISDIPGGQQVLDRYLSGFLRDTETVGAQSEADLHTVSEDVARPNPLKESNCEALPNPWKVTPQPEVWAHPAPMSMPFLPSNPFEMGEMGMESQGSTAGIMNNLMASLVQDPNLAQESMRMSAANQNTNTNINSNNYIHYHPTVESAMTNSQANTNASGSFAASPFFSEEKKIAYEPQLRALKDMGFEDEWLCLKALEATNGDVEEALAYIAESQSN
ncbi:unnamed protein product [Phytomonas sp. Hart1]|nr:unnamed protein product [Phytomonas sp. Hart1]|eukprot:CCW71110.1 unnamed protein product [Phytomonas sp. isolate Hart1]